MRIATNGINLHVSDHGTGAPALVFLHYWGGSARTWRHVRSALDFRTIAIDQRGWGRSDAPATGYGLTDLADDVEGAIAALGLDRYVLIGHSMGGKVAQLLAARRPSGLAGLVLVAPSPPSPLELPREVREAMVTAYDSRAAIVATVEHVLAGSALRDGDLETVIEDSLRGAPAAKAAWPLATSQEDITRAIAAIAVPAIVISGELDRVDPPAILERTLMPRLANASLYILPGVGHLSPLEAPDRIAALITDFVCTALEA